MFQKLVTLGEETINTTVFTQVDQGEVYLMADQLTRYVLVGEPCRQGRSPCVKLLRLAVFIPPLSTIGHTTDYSARVYAVEDNMAAIEVHTCQNTAVCYNSISSLSFKIMARVFRFGQACPRFALGQNRLAPFAVLSI